MDHRYEMYNQMQTKVVPLSPISSIAADRVITTFSSRLLKTKAPTFLKVLLMILLGPIEFLCGKDFSDDLPLPGSLLLLHGFSSSLFLFWRVEIYSRSILCPNIVSLNAIMTAMDRIFQQCECYCGCIEPCI